MRTLQAIVFIVLCCCGATSAGASSGSTSRSLTRASAKSTRPAPPLPFPKNRIIPPPPGKRAITDVLHDSLVTVIAQNPVDMSDWRPVDIEGHCGWLDPAVWRHECSQNSDFYKALEPMSTYIVMVKDHNIDHNSINEKVPGTVFKASHYFSPQYYVRPPVPIASDPVLVDKLATVLQAYPTAFGHFPHEILPKLVYLLEHVPADVKFLLDVSPFTEQYLRLLSINESRIIRYRAKAHKVYSANEVYFSNTHPFIHSEDPHKGGKTFLFPKVLIDRMNQRVISALPPAAPEDQRSDLVVLLQRKMYARNLTNFAELRDALAEKVGRDRIRIFTGAEPVATALRWFSSAALVVGVHGGGLANIAFCSKDTHIIEIGFDSSGGMNLDNMYAMLSSQTGKLYHLVRGRGTYKSPVTVTVSEVLAKVPCKLDLNCAPPTT